MELSYGFIETKGFIAAVEAADAMLKTASVELVKWHKTGGSLVVIIVQGELGACQAAVNAGSAAASQAGELVSSNIIARPFDDTYRLIEEYIGNPRKTPAAGQPEPKNPPVTVTKKSVRPAAKKQRPASISPSEKILAYLQGKSNGANLQDISKHIKMTTIQTRLIIKELLDTVKIEKIRNLYFPIKGRPRK